MTTALPRTALAIAAASLLGFAPVAGRDTIDPGLFTGEGRGVRTLEASRVIPAPPDAVFDQITTADGIRAWLGVESSVDLAIGGAYELALEPGKPRGSRGTEGSQILAYAPDRMLAVAWNAPPSLGAIRGQRTWVSFLIEPAQGGSRVSIIHAGFGDTPGWEEAYRYYETGWPTVLGRLARSLGEAAD
jgi:uncharacterized protein YndB with AHSA1/START domain